MFNQEVQTSLPGEFRGFLVIIFAALVAETVIRVISIKFVVYTRFLQLRFKIINLSR